MADKRHSGIKVLVGALCGIAVVLLLSSLAMSEASQQKKQQSTTTTAAAKPQLSPERIKALAKFRHQKPEQVPVAIREGIIPQECVNEPDVWSFRNCMKKKSVYHFLLVQFDIVGDADFRKPFQWYVMWRSLVLFLLFGQIGIWLKKQVDKRGEKSAKGDIYGCLGTIIVLFILLPLAYFFIAGLL